MLICSRIISLFLTFLKDNCYKYYNKSTQKKYLDDRRIMEAERYDALKTMEHNKSSSDTLYKMMYIANLKYELRGTDLKTSYNKGSDNAQTNNVTYIVFKTWFKVQLLQHLPQCSVIVMVMHNSFCAHMDNSFSICAILHSCKSIKSHVQILKRLILLLDYLQMEFLTIHHKELLHLVNTHKLVYCAHEIDKIAMPYGHPVVRPPLQPN